MYCPSFDNYYYSHNIIINPCCEKILSYTSAIIIKENITKILTNYMLPIGNGEWIFSQVSVRKSKVDTIFIVGIHINGEVRANIKYVNDGTNFHFMIAYADAQEYYTYNGEYGSFAPATKFKYYNFINDIYATYNTIYTTGNYHYEC